MSWRAGWLAQIGLYDDCYALCLPLVSQVVGGPVGGHFCRSEVFYYCRGWLCWSRLCVWGLAMGNKPIRDCGFFLFGTGVSQTPCCCCLCWLCRLSRRSLLYSLAFVGLAVGGFLVFLEFAAPFFRIYFLGLLKSAWSWQCGGQHCRGRVIPGGLRLAMLWWISFVSCSLFCYSWLLGHRKT